ncbi:hypothetical protein KSP40_PGU002108 [Platanthera guangdongensis]|uniref:Methyltransferase type 12 domain-containing protein n=1 Tax=Platanthera guangdongensis TaxID=2320717 RepID=A0ABR2MRS3_9ASPA
MATEDTTGSPAVDVKKTQIYPPTSSSSGRQVTPFWREKYEREAMRYWDLFYKRHQNKFFKDRHYLEKEWGRYFQERDNLVLLEVGCGVGNTIFPLVSTYPAIYIHACDFSPRAIDLVKAHNNYRDDQINAFVCDLTWHDLNEWIPSSSVDIVTMVFVLSAVSPEKMPSVLQNIRKVLKPSGRILIRDYAYGDLAQERLTDKEQQISKNFFVRGDGTRVYYFSEDFLTNLFKENGFDDKNVSIYSKQVENRSKKLVMKRRWIQAVFSLNSESATGLTRSIDQDLSAQRFELINSSKAPTLHTEVDVSESIAELFDSEPSFDEDMKTGMVIGSGFGGLMLRLLVITINARSCCFKIRGLAREYQHTCQSTGLMLWESAHIMCTVIAENPSIVAGKRVLELGCGSAGICSMISAQFAEFVLSTDGDIEALRLLRENVTSNLEQNLVEKIAVEKLVWGASQDLQAIKELGCYKGGFEVILGTDVCYSPGAIHPLFFTAKELLLNETWGKPKPSLILCHIQRRVHEDSIISAAADLGFRLKDRWVNGMCRNDGIISSWFSSDSSWNDSVNTPLTILYFELGDLRT